MTPTPSFVPSSSSSPRRSSSSSSSLLLRAACELEAIRHVPKHVGVSLPTSAANCLRLIHQLPGNHVCIDCASAANPGWASVSFGSLLCLECSGKHRGYGVKTSYVKSLRLDAWNHREILSLLEGGNVQLRDFFERHRMGETKSKSPNTTASRYHTKAGHFYRTNLSKHVAGISLSQELYQGRHVNRQRYRQQQQQQVQTRCRANSRSARSLSVKQAIPNARRRRSERQASFRSSRSCGEQHQQQQQQQQRYYPAQSSGTTGTTATVLPLLPPVVR